MASPLCTPPGIRTTDAVEIEPGAGSCAASHPTNPKVPPFSKMRPTSKIGGPPRETPTPAPTSPPPPPESVPYPPPRTSPPRSPRTLRGDILRPVRASGGDPGGRADRRIFALLGTRLRDHGDPHISFSEGRTAGVNPRREPPVRARRSEFRRPGCRRSGGQSAVRRRDVRSRPGTGSRSPLTSRTSGASPKPTQYWPPPSRAAWPGRGADRPILAGASVGSTLWWQDSGLRGSDHTRSTADPPKIVMSLG